MKVLSLFDGMSCGQIALNRLGIKVDKYYASEIDKYAIQVTQKNYPDTIQVGDITKLNPNDFKDVDLIMAGSPCQGFSFAGKQLAFDDPRSALFFEFIRLLKAIKPRYFLLENVRMKKEYLEVITEQVSQCYPNEGNDLFKNRLEPILINSALVSAQSRQRYYWTNIPGIEQPEDKGILLKDILETETDDVYLVGKDLQQNYKGGNQLNPKYKSQANTIHNRNGKSGTLCSGTHGYANGYVNNKPIKAYVIPREILKDNERQRRVYEPIGKSPTILGRSDSPKITTPKQIGIATDIKGHEQIKRVYSPEGKSPTLTTCGGGHREPKIITNKIRDKSKTVRTSGRLSYDKHEWDSVDELHWRKLTPLECERLQTVPDNYTEGVSNTQRYRMLGNGWTVDVICHILKDIKDSFINNTEITSQQAKV